jgi:hypothetical protein
MVGCSISIMIKSHTWIAGIAIIVVWLGMLQIIAVIQGNQIIDRWLFLMLLLLPVTSSVIVAYYEKVHVFRYTTVLIALVAVFGPTFDIVGQRIGVTTDFPGVAGLKTTFWIYLFTGFATIIPGAIIGLLFKKFAR